MIRCWFAQSVSFLITRDIASLIKMVKYKNIIEEVENGTQATFQKKSQILMKKLDASTSETMMFDEELQEISD